MIGAFCNLESTLGITVCEVRWCRSFPYKDLLETYKDTPMLDSVKRVINRCKQEGLDRVDSPTLYRAGCVAEEEGLLLAYFIVHPNSIHLFFYPMCDTIKWMDMFKENVNKRVFFEYVRTYKQESPYVLSTPNSTYYQLYNSHLPDDFIVESSIIENSYIIVKYSADYFTSITRVFKIVGFSLVELEHTINYDYNSFNPIKLSVDGRIFIGSSLKLLKESFAPRQNQHLHISYGNSEIEIDQDKGVMSVKNLSTYKKVMYKIPKFNTKRNLSVIKELSGGVVLLNNGFVFDMVSLFFVNTSSIYPEQDIRFQSLSRDDYIVISPKQGVLEIIPNRDFLSLIGKYKRIIPEVV